MKLSQFRRIIKEEVRRVLREERPPTFVDGKYMYITDLNEFSAKLEELWGKKKSQWTVEKNGIEVSPTTKFTERDRMNYTINGMGIADWDPTRPSKPLGYPPGSILTKTNMTQADFVYPD